MIKNVYAIRDSKSCFLLPFCDDSDGSAIRGFSYSVQHNNDIVGFAPADFDLYRIGTYNTTNAVLTEVTPVLVAHATDFVTHE